MISKWLLTSNSPSLTLSNKLTLSLYPIQVFLSNPISWIKVLNLTNQQIGTFLTTNLTLRMKWYKFFKTSRTHWNRMKWYKFFKTSRTHWNCDFNHKQIETYIVDRKKNIYCRSVAWVLPLLNLEFSAYKIIFKIKDSQSRRIQCNVLELLALSLKLSSWIKNSSD